MNVREYDTRSPYHAVVRETTRITPEGAAEVRHIVLGVPPGFSFTEGQSLGVLTPGPHPFGNAQHLRLYSIAEPRGGADGEIAICVRRCFYIDEVSGERYKGISSNYLCDARAGDTITLTGPYGTAFQMPEDETANVLMIGTGTGIAPFRAFIKRIFDQHRGWKGRVRLFYGARVGMELLYMNQVRNDLEHYYTQETFRAFAALTPRALAEEDSALQRSLEDNAQEVWDLVRAPGTHVYVAGLTRTALTLDKTLANLATSAALWRWKKEEMVAEGRWSELFYD
jgi:ferredoxin--NADP+ reductase